VEADAKEPTGVTRGQNVVHVMPLDWSAAGDALASIIDRIDQARAETQVLIVTSDAENAAASPRAARLLKASAAHVVTGAPAELVALTQSSALKAEAIRGVVFAWLDPILETPEAAPLENLLGELPKDGARVVLASELTPAYEALIERYARRARRAAEAPADDQAKPLGGVRSVIAHVARCIAPAPPRCARPSTCRAVRTDGEHSFRGRDNRPVTGLLVRCGSHHKRRDAVGIHQ
jgi:hypothetical protein